MRILRRILLLPRQRKPRRKKSPAPNTKPQPNSVKPKEETPPKAKKPQPKPSATTTRQSTKRTKRSHSNAENGGSEEEEPESKKSEGDDSKKVLFQRVWSKDDEIAILKGMIDFTAKTGAGPAVANMNEFHDFIKKSLQIGASKTQLSDKVRRLKKKINPTKPHEMAAFQLSKRIWGWRAELEWRSKEWPESQVGGAFVGLGSGGNRNS